ncbi:MAG: mcpB 2 [Sporomusa sp.]|jgi:methyl-accepting chemotaxis protein|nr:mcpB 2 [Sporomusa sp.]
MSIKTKTLLLLVAALLVSGIIVGSTGIYMLYKQTLSSTELAMNNQTEQLAGQVEDLFEAFAKSGKTYGLDSDLQSNNPAQIQSKMNTYFGVSWGIDRLNVLDVKGTRIAIAPYDAKVIGDNLSDRKFFKDTVSTQKSQLSDIIINRVTGVPSIILTQPITVNNQLTGMVLQAVNLDTLQNFLAEVKVAFSGIVAIVAEDGTLIAHTNKEIIKEQKKIPENLIKRFKEQPGHLLYDKDVSNNDSMMLAVPIKNTNWLAIVALPTAEFRTGFYSTAAWMVASLCLGLLIVGLIVWRFLFKTLHPLESLVEEATKISEGDLTLTSLGIHSNDEVGRLAQSFEKMTTNLRSLMQKIAEATEQVASSSEELNANAEQSVQAANQVSASIYQTSQGTEKQTATSANTLVLAEQITASAQKSAKDVKQASDITEKAARSASEGSHDVREAITQMDQIQRTVNSSSNVVTELGYRSKEIGMIMETISNIAKQTNLLALNAAIEAARAGEQGRGFAVVAEEVRKLAEQSQSATEEIAELIHDIQEKTQHAVQAMTTGTSEAQKGMDAVNKAGKAFKEIELQVQDIAAISKETATELERLVTNSTQVLSAAQEVDEISRDIAAQTQNISSATEEQSAAMQEISSSSQGLANLAGDLQHSVHQFKI